ncbi:MAG TPA: class I SAM-dependent methyltransferase [Acidimicrobiales bacterium]|nr:class I SAM-dependent methyltransferase [Acidimicrobiales bacterium]
MPDARRASPRGFLTAAERRLRRALASRLAPPERPATYPIVLDYPVRPEPRFGYGKPPHPELYDLYDRHREQFVVLLQSFLEYSKPLTRIPLDSQDPRSPYWCNGSFQGLDAVALYCLISKNRPHRYVEIGSGNSTKWARRAAQDQDVSLHITSVDPVPRAEIDDLCDHIERSPLEDVDLSMFDKLGPGDIFFVDGSHRCFMNSDVTVVFTELLPRLAPGVLVHIHDVFIPWDYPPQMAEWYFSEQYLAAAYLLSGEALFEVVLPNFFVCIEPSLHEILSPLWSTLTWAAVPTNGTSLWLQRAGLS